MARLTDRFAGPARVLLAYLALAFLFLWPLWTSFPADRMMIGAPDGDFLRQFYPYRAFVAGAWGSAHVPLWNPHQYGGTPAWADPQQAVLYPWRWLQIPLALGGRVLPLWSVELEVVGHLALGCWFTYLLVRRLGAPGVAAFLAGLTFGFGGYLTGYPVEQLAVLDTAVWIPVVLWALTGALDSATTDWRSAARWALVAAVATAFTALAGHPQTAMYGLWAGLGWVAWRSVSEHVPAPRALVLCAIWLVVACGLAAAQWLPSLELMRHAGPRFNPDELLAGFPIGDAVQLVAPGVVSEWSPLYVGVPALILAAWSAGAARPVRYWLGLAFVSWLIALGGNGPLFPLLLRIAPATGLFRHQERMAVVVSLSLAVAAGLGLGELMERSPVHVRRATGVAASLAAVAGALAAAGVARPSALAALGGATGVALPAEGGAAALADALAFTAMVAVLAALALGLRVAGRLGPRGLGASLVVLTILDLFSVNHGRVLSPRVPVYEPGPIVEALAPLARDGRVSSEALLPGGPNAASVFGLFDVTGDSPLQLVWTRDLEDALPELTWWRLLGVRYVVTTRAFEPTAPLTELVRSGETALYRVELPVPPAWVPGQIERAGRRWYPAPDFDPLETAILAPESPWGAGDAAGYNAKGTPGSAEDAPGGEARLVALTPGHATVEATLRHPGVLVLSTAYDPGWRARARNADGAEIKPEVELAYTALAAVQLPAGRWTVEWTYRPNAVIFGLLVSGLTVIMGAVMWCYARR